MSSKSRLMPFIHKMLCPDCRHGAAEWSRLSHEVEQLEDDTLPPSLDEKLVRDAMAAAASARESRLTAARVFTVRRALFALTALLLVAAGIIFFPRRQNTALADVSRAMARVRSVHFVGWETDSAHGRSTMEGWIVGDSKLRYREEGEAWLDDYGDDGKIVVEVNTYSRNPYATIRASDNDERWPMELSLSLFRGHNVLEDARNPLHPSKITSRKATLPDGRKAVIYQIGWSTGEATLTVDAETDLIWKIETLKHFDSREVREAIDRIEYNVEIPDSIFRPSIPRGLRVLDLTKPLSPDIARRRQAEMKRLQIDPGVHITWHIPGGQRSSCGAIYRKGYMFEVAGPGEIMIAYVPALDVYRVIGTVRAFSLDGRYSRYAQDEDVRLPGKPNLHEYEEALMENAGPGAYRGIEDSDPRWGFQRFLNIGKTPLTILLDTHRDVYIIKGKAKLLPFGIVYENQTVKTDAIPDIRAVGDPKKLDWTGLPRSEIEAAKAELDIYFRARELEKARVPGAKPVYSGTRGGGSCGSYHHGLKFHIKFPGPILIQYLPETNTYRVTGKVEVWYPDGRTEVIENADIQAPGPPDRE